MAEASQVATSRKATAVALGAAVVAGLLALTLRSERAPDVAVPTPPAEPAQVEADAGAGPQDAGEQAAGSDADATSEPNAPTIIPGFDVVRVAPDGAAVVAGTAAPGARVTISSGDLELAETEADADGNFVAIFRAEPSADPRTLTLESETPRGARSVSDDVVVLLPGPGVDLSAQAAPEGSVPEQPAAASTTAPEVAVPAQDASAQPEVAVAAIVRRDAVEVTPSAPPDPTKRQVALASISYGETGGVTLSGAGTAGSALRAYLDGTLAREADVGPDGRWSLDLGDVARGLYRLRIDQIAPDGRVASRVETPFQRDVPAAPKPRPGGGPGLSITVQPGSNLWTIARTHYGSGVRYTQIFTANRDLIRDPDLIYPGQVLALPAAEETD